MAFELQDEVGQRIESPLLQVSTNEGMVLDSILLEITSYPQKELRVDLQNVTQGIPALGYLMTGFTVEPATVTVAAPADVLQDISRVFLQEPLSLNGAQASFSVMVPLRNIAGVHRSSADEVLVSVTLEDEKVRREVRNLTVEVIGLPAEMNYRLSRVRMNLNIEGGYWLMQEFKDGDAHVYVDVTGLPLGDHDVPVFGQVGDGAQAYTCFPELDTIRVILQARQN